MTWTGLLRRTVIWARPVFLVALSVVVVAPGGAPPAEGENPAGRVQAVFEGGTIDLAGDWGDATACLVWDAAGGVECFRAEDQMNQRITELEGKLGKSEVSLAAAPRCSGSVRLYDGALYTGDVLHVRDRLTWINLGNYGFSNRTSSFKIGPCSSYLADYNNGDGSWYSTSKTQAGDVASIMDSGWNNRISSIYIR